MPCCSDTMLDIENAKNNSTSVGENPLEDLLWWGIFGWLSNGGNASKEKLNTLGKSCNLLFPKLQVVGRTNWEDRSSNTVDVFEALRMAEIKTSISTSCLIMGGIFCRENRRVSRYLRLFLNVNNKHYNLLEGLRHFLISAYHGILVLDLWDDSPFVRLYGGAKDNVRDACVIEVKKLGTLR